MSSFTALNQEFHAILFARCANPRMLELVNAEWSRLGHLRDSTFSFVPGRAAESVREHENILTLIEQAIPDQPFMHLVNLIHEDMAIVDAKVVTDSQIAGKRIVDLPVPENCIIAAIIRAGELIIPSATTAVQVGDDLIAITHRSVEEDLRKLLM